MRLKSNWTETETTEAMDNLSCGYEREYWHECASRILSDKSIRALEAGAGKHHIGIICLQIEGFYDIVGAHGEDAGFRVLDVLKEEALRHFAHFFKANGILAVESSRVNEIVIFFRISEREMCNLASETLAFRIRVRNSVNEKLLENIGRPVDVLAGQSWIDKDQNLGFCKVLFKAYCDSQRVAVSKVDPSKFKFHEEFIGILTSSGLRCFYQPINDLKTGSIMGWEALIRPPEESHFHEPCMLFGYAEEIGKVFSLEKRCRNLAIRHFGDGDERRLFLNNHLQSLSDPGFSPASTVSMLRTHNLNPENVVMEFSERYGIQDFSLLLECLEQYRGYGFKIALDNVGAGHSSLHSISQIRPDFIKIDMSLTRGIDFNPIKRVMVETFVALSEKIGSYVIVSGIETATELSSLAAMGVHYGQGHFIARPEFPKSERQVEIPVPVVVAGKNSYDLKCSTPVSGLVQSSVQVAPDMTVKQVKDLLVGRPPISSVVVVRDARPLGLLMNYDLDRRLGTAFGYSLYYNREVHKVMDPSPLVVETGEPVEQVAKAAMNREDQKVYDDIIVTEQGKFVGVISVQKMLDTLARVQVEMAKGANPLTGLPGNVSIEQEINRRGGVKIPSSLIYIDLDNFKVYNDVYGFDNGDRVILFTSKVLADVVGAVGLPGDFIGHVGGDDFIVISAWESAERIAQEIVARFENEIHIFYKEADRKRGHIVGRGRDGQERVFPFISVSIGIVDCEFRHAFTMDELSLRMAEVKKYAKTIQGNSLVKDRRTPLGSAPSVGELPELCNGLH